MARTRTRPVTVLSEASSSSRTPVAGLSIGDYLIQRLWDYGVRDVFGIPGDYVLSFYAKLQQSRLKTVGCTSEDCAGFAADAYARLNGIGAVCVTYCVGGLSLCNAVAGAYAEKSPVVVISGSPGLRERVHNPLLHHRVRDFRTQFEVFRRLCVAAAELNDPDLAMREIDRVLDAVVRHRRPGYIELPRDMVAVVPDSPYRPKVTEARSDPAALAEALAEATALVARSQRPVILAGVEIHRFGLQDQLLRLAEEAGIPIATTLLGKSVVRETHPLFAGVYEGAMGREDVTAFVEQSDCVIVLGTFMTDIDLGIFTANLDPAKCIYATSEELRISHHNYHDVLLPDFVAGLVGAGLKVPPREIPSSTSSANLPFELRPHDPITIRRVIARLNQALDPSTVVIADVGDALFASTDLVIQQRTEFISPAYYTSMGFAVPAVLGAMTARPELRAVALVGDGAFQMTGMELSNVVRRGLDPIILVLDNRGYGTERLLHPGDHSFNDIQPWHYHRLPEVLGGGRGYEVRTEGQFDEALRSAWADRTGMSLIQIHLDPKDCSQALERLGRRLGARI